jgi:hypothetical protein
MNIPYNIEVYDNLISVKQHNKIWECVKNLTFYGTWLTESQVNFNYTLNSPKTPNDWMVFQTFGRTPKLHRAPLASDEDSLKSRHLPIYLLWKELNTQLGGQYEITGNPEGMRSDVPVPEQTDPDLKLGWRVYVNANYNSHIGRGGQGYVHRDTPLEHNDDKTVTMLYVANPEWYPSWAGELKFYPEDPDGLTGEHQQFNMSDQQQRGYNVGWLDKGRVVSTVPGRLIIYDGRCLHGTVPAGGPLETPSIKIVFRARRK